MYLEIKHNLLLKKSAKKYKKQREANAKKQKNKTSLIDHRTYQQLKEDDFISLAPKNKTSSFIDDRTYQELKDDQEFQKVRIKDLNDLNNVHMFSTSLRGSKAFAAEQKIRELKSRISKFVSQKLKISPNKIIEMSTANMNIQPSKKYGFSPEEVEKRALQSQRFRPVCNIHRLEKADKLNKRQDRCRDQRPIS